MKEENIYEKLFKAKFQIGKITKDSKNPFFKSNYLSLNGLIEAVEEVLDDHDLLLLQPIVNNKVETVIFDIKTKEHIASSIELPAITDPQKLGSAITYYRRYTLQSLLGLQAEDDDGNSATKQVKKQAKPTLNIASYEKALLSTNKEGLTKSLQMYNLSAIQIKGITKRINEL